MPSSSSTNGTTTNNGGGTAAGLTYTLRDYLFPYTAKYHAVFDETDTTTSPNGSASSSTSSIDVAVATYSTTVAITHTLQTYSAGGSTPSTDSFSIQPDGSVRDLETYTDLSSASTISFSPSLLSPGATVTIMPTTGAAPTLMANQAGTESITVPAGTYTAIKLSTFNPQPYGTLWYAPNVGLVRSTYAYPQGSATISVNIVLRSIAK